MTRTASIIGAGIGGLSAAIALAQAGWDVRVFERRTSLVEMGAGIQMSPNACKVLDALGCFAAVKATAFAPDAIEMRMGTSGRLVFSLSLRQAERRWGGAYLHIHRGDLLAALVDRAGQLPGITISTNMTAQAVDDSTVSFADGTQTTADLVVVADGMNSRLARSLVNAPSPEFSGCIAWRTTVPMDRLTTAPPPTACAWVGAGKHAVTTRIKSGTVANFVGVVETDHQPPESWRHTGDRARALADFAGWHPTLVDILDRADDLHCWSLMERTPLRHWARGNAVLLGDAAHPMLPSMAQGAAQAMEDAVALAACLDWQADVALALKDFQQTRQPRAAKVQALSAANLKLFHRGHVLTQLATYGPAAVAARIAPSLLHRRQDWVYGHDPLHI